MSKKSFVKSQASFDKRLEDIKYKLKDLGFSYYSLEHASSVAVPVSKKSSISLSQGYTLEVEVIYAKKKRVGLLLNWHDSMGRELLNTKMHIRRKESMIAGFDKSESQGVLLAVGVAK